MKIHTEHIEKNSKVDNSRTVMTAVYVTMMAVGAAIMLRSSPEAVQTLTAHPIPMIGVSPELMATAGAISMAIFGALKFLNKSIDAMMHDDTAVCSSAEDLDREMDKIPKEVKELKEPSKRNLKL